MDFGSSIGSVHITDTVLTGSAYGENIGWITLNPQTYGGVANNAEGTLSGYAWSENAGWIDFSKVTIGSDGVFAGSAYGENIGWITFGTGNNKVSTDWRPSSARPSSSRGSKSGTIKVINIVINDNGGAKTVADFPLFINGAPIISNVINTFPAPALVYTVTETGNANYTKQFSGGCDSAGRISLSPGDNKVCTITNDDIGASAAGTQSGNIPAPDTTPNTAQAPIAILPSDLTSSQIKAILDVLASFNADASVIANVKASLGGVAIGPTSDRVTYAFKSNLTLGSVGNEVKALQEYLNAHGYSVATSGAGSPRNETMRFGAATKTALIKFQRANGITPAVGYFGPKTRNFINNLTQ